MANEKLPPQNIEAEKSVIGSMLIEPEALQKVVELLKEDSFYRDSHRKIFSAVMRLFDNNQPVDLITVAEELKKNNELDRVGGAEYIAELINTVPTAANVEYYAGIVKEKSALRDLINISTAIITDAYNENSVADTLLDKAEHQIFSISEKRIRPGFLKMKDLVHASIQKIEELSYKQVLVTGVPTGFEKLDEMTTGLHGGELIVIAARPGMGKTSLCLSIALNASIRYKIPVAIFSLEMAADQIVLRMLSAEARVSMHRLRSGKTYDNEWPNITMAASHLAEAPIYIDDSSSISALEIKAKCRRLKADKDIGLIVVDYLQLMESTRGTENRVQEVSQVTRSLKGLAKEMGVPVIVASQLSRATEKQEKMERRPLLSHLRESGSIEQDADAVLMLYRESYYNREIENKAETELIIAKQRNGPVGTLKIAFLDEYAKFDNLTIAPQPLPSAPEEM
ncbi:MAG: replicative DNA helicase [Candidatus Firestonebacteria bacterium RIFOXYC2_FULL_39_67]|nr:MAG: replicative DNA helicase [Candidatus Firestonebacteria bacterium RIFOXYD2_FULL_39_29]OGF56203.1 MAG: replicative DNA helicase [Candidatus Firestonebacteria bacterium RIFOXYC2_FULL_39_67]OGF57282.1 MAG: replicative DNA helicase [Candidatus Firestonebacteria bacterium RifOxyC12_full_39_7]